MTLIVSIITNRNSFIICDKMHSIDGSDENPAEVTLQNGNSTIKIKSPKIRINTGTKIYKISDNLFIGGAGDFNKIQKFVKTIDGLTENNIVAYTQKYYNENKRDSPDQLLILTNQLGIPNVDAIYINQNDEFFAFNDFNFTLNNTNLGVLAIGSGGPLFLLMYDHIKKQSCKEYKEAIEKDEYDKWESSFLAKIKEMFYHVSKYDDAVSEDIEIYKL